MGLTIPYRLIIEFLVVLGIIGTIWYQTQKISSLEKQVSQQSVNLKSYMQGMQSYVTKDNVLHTQSIQQEQTIQALQASKDKVDQALQDSLHKWKIKPSTVTQLGVITDNLHNEKTVALPTKQGKLLDSTINLSDQPYISETLTIKQDTNPSLGYKVTRKLDVSDTLTLVWHTKKETVNPPRKFFLWRLLQKKQLVGYADVVHSNPYIKTNSQKFVHIVK